MFPAFLKLRKMDPDTERPYKVPGGEGVLKVMAWLPFIQIVLCLILTCVPLAFDAETLAGTLPITIGAILIIIIDEVYIRVKGTPTSAPTFRLSTPPPKRTRSRVRNREALLFHGPRRAVTRRGLFQSREEHVMRNSKLLAAGSAILVSFAVAVANAIASGERIGMLPIMLLTHVVLAGGYMIFSALTEQPEAASEPLDEAAASTALPDATSFPAVSRRCSPRTCATATSAPAPTSSCASAIAIPAEHRSGLTVLLVALLSTFSLEARRHERQPEKLTKGLRAKLSTLQSYL